MPGCFEKNLAPMPLPPALQARLAKRGIIQNGKVTKIVFKIQSYPVTKVIMRLIIKLQLAN